MNLPFEESVAFVHASVCTRFVWYVLGFECVAFFCLGLIASSYAFTACSHVYCLFPVCEIALSCLIDKCISELQS